MPSPAMPKMSAEDRRRQRQYEIDDAMRTLARAEQIKQDAELMGDVRKLATDLKRVAGREPKKPERKAK
jgi:hypothetical protein